MTFTLLGTSNNCCCISCFVTVSSLKLRVPVASVHTEQLPVNSKTVENLVSSISSGCKPTSVLQQLCLLKVYVEEKDTDKLEKALKALYSNSFMSEGQSQYDKSKNTLCMSDDEKPGDEILTCLSLSRQVSSRSILPQAVLLTCPCMLTLASFCEPSHQLYCSPDQTCPYLPPPAFTCTCLSSPAEAGLHYVTRWRRPPTRVSACSCCSSQNKWRICRHVLTCMWVFAIA